MQLFSGLIDPRTFVDLKMCQFPLLRVPLYMKTTRTLAMKKPSDPSVHAESRSSPTSRVTILNNVSLAANLKRARFSKPIDQHKSNVNTTPVKEDNRRFPVRNQGNSKRNTATHLNTPRKSGTQMSKTFVTPPPKLPSIAKASHKASPTPKASTPRGSPKLTSPSRSSPSRSSPSRSSPSSPSRIEYAGARFNEPPEPELLPLPPMSWVSPSKEPCRGGNIMPAVPCRPADITGAIRVMLKLQA